MIKAKDFASSVWYPHPAPFEVSKGVRLLLPPNQDSRSSPSSPTHTLTLALEFADDGVQVSVLGRDVAPADRHLPAAASAGSQQRLGSLRLRLSSRSAASRLGCEWAPPRPGGPRGSVPRPPSGPTVRFPSRPSRAATHRTSSPRARPGAVRAAVLKEAAQPRRGGGNFSRTRPGRGGATTPTGRSWAGVPRQAWGRAFLRRFCSCSSGQWPQPL